MKIIKSPSVFVIFLVLLMILLVAFSGCTDEDIKEQQNFSVSTKNTCWSPYMSSIVGIDLTGHGGEDEYIFHWTAKGDGSSDVEFISWGNETEFKVFERGNHTWTAEGEIIWWSYRGYNNSDNMPEKFTVLMSAANKDTYETVFEKEIEIKREDVMFCVE